jgi:DNA-binding response OmpR family regulator
LRIDFDAYEVCVDGFPVHVRRREFQLLCFFVQWPNRVFDRAQIVVRVWPETSVKVQTVDVYVHRLRRCIERDLVHPEVLVTVRGFGWKFVEQAL